MNIEVSNIEDSPHVKLAWAIRELVQGQEAPDVLSALLIGVNAVLIEAGGSLDRFVERLRLHHAACAEQVKTAKANGLMQGAKQ